jgi:hypothetical protein
MRKKLVAVGMVAAWSLLFAQALAAQTSGVRVLASNGIKAVVEDLLSQAQRTIGHTILVQYRRRPRSSRKLMRASPSTS